MTSLLVILILVLYMAYSVYKAFVIYKKHRTTLKAFQAEHADARLFDNSKGWVISSVIMCIVCLLIALTIDRMNVPKESLTAYRLLYVVIAVIFATMVFSSLAGKRLWFVDDGFFFGDRFFKFKEVDRKEPIGGIGSHSLRLIMKDRYAIQINKKMDEQIDSAMKLWKSKKKRKNK